MKTAGNENVIVMAVGTNTYMTVKDLAKWYRRTEQTIRNNVAKMRETGRYNNRYLVLDQDGKWLVNTLMYEDYMACKSALDNGLAKTLEPYDPAEIRRQRGEYRVAI